VHDGGTEHDTQTMDAATESQRQMMHMTQLDNVNDDDDDDDADRPDVPPEVENDVVQVLPVHGSLSCNHFQATRTTSFDLRIYSATYS